MELFARATLLVAIAVALLSAPACGGGPIRTDDPSRATSDAGEMCDAAQCGDGSSVTEDRFCAIGDALAARLGVAVDAALANTSLTPEEGQTLLRRLSPDGAWPDMLHVMKEQGLTPGAVDAFVRAHKDAADRCGDRMAHNMNAIVARSAPIAALVSRGTLAWRDDVVAARIDALKTNRPMFVRFFVAWSKADYELDKTTFADPAVRQILSRDFVPVRMDLTEEDAPATKRTMAEYKVAGFPTMIIFDAKGREVRRITEYLSANALATVLASLRDAK